MMPGHGLMSVFEHDLGAAKCGEPTKAGCFLAGFTSPLPLRERELTSVANLDQSNLIML
jgi:hypothetical protein